MTTAFSIRMASNKSKVVKVAKVHKEDNRI